MKKLALAVAILCASSLFAQKEAQWSGPNRDGVFPETGLLVQWPQNGISKLWSFEGLGEGYSSPTIANGKVYVTGMVEGQGYLCQLDQKTGKLIKKIQYGEEWNKSYPGTRSIATVNNGMIYLTSGNGVIYCFNEKDLEVVWKKNMTEAYNSREVTWGINESSLIVDNTLIAIPGGENASIVALDKKTGNTIWESPGVREKSAYNSPMLIKGHGDPIVALHTENHLVGVDLKTGKLRFSFEHTTRFPIHPNTPIYSDGKLMIVSGYKKGVVMLKVAPDGNSVKMVWENKNMDNQMGSLVKVGNYIYGSGQDTRKWMCADWDTGEIKWEDATFGPSTAIAAEGMVYGYSDKGDLFMIKATPEKFDLKGRMTITEGTKEHWAHLVIAQKVLYVRHGDAIMAFNIKR